MKKLAKLGRYIVALPLLLAILASVVTFFFFQEYKNLALGIMCLLSSEINISTGIQQLQKAKRIRGEHPLWWKNYLIIMGLGWGCFGVLECFGWVSTTSKLPKNLINDPIWAILGAIFIIPTMSIMLYGLVLTLKHLEDNKKAKQSQLDDDNLLNKTD